MIFILLVHSILCTEIVEYLIPNEHLKNQKHLPSSCGQSMVEKKMSLEVSGIRYMQIDLANSDFLDLVILEDSTKQSRDENSSNGSIWWVIIWVIRAIPFQKQNGNSIVTIVRLFQENILSPLMQKTDSVRSSVTELVENIHSLEKYSLHRCLYPRWCTVNEKACPSKITFNSIKQPIRSQKIHLLLQPNLEISIFGKGNLQKNPLQKSKGFFVIYNLFPIIRPYFYLHPSKQICSQKHSPKKKTQQRIYIHQNSSKNKSMKEDFICMNGYLQTSFVWVFFLIISEL